ncbi:MAG TPA: hypothetical protein VHW96_22720, partial [Solirubrobacteraceae bacterium]|nr:hypothetical protein [Solirubrobacteraceae bacterium]
AERGLSALVMVDEPGLTAAQQAGATPAVCDALRAAPGGVPGQPPGCARCPSFAVAHVASAGPAIRPRVAVPLAPMRLQGIRAGDLVLCDVKGRRFHAEVTTTATGAELEILPLLRGVTYRRVSARSVVEHWRKAGRRADGGQAGNRREHDTEVADDVLFTLG